MSRQIRLGLIGLGNMGTGHLSYIAAGKCPEITVTAAADIKPERLKALDGTAPGAARFHTAQEMLDSGLVEAVLVATPHYSHPELAVLCLKRGIHVMIEKPAGVYTKQIQEMNEAARYSDAVFGIMFNQRTDHIYRKMRELLQSGELGGIRRVNWVITEWFRSQFYFDSSAWRATWSGEGGSLLLNQCHHQLDLLQWICGMPVKVDAKLHFGKWHDIETEDDVTAYMEFENGATGVFVTSTGDYPGSNRLEITLDGGKLVSENGQLTLWRLEQPVSEFITASQTAFGAPEMERITVETDGKSEQHAGVLNAFAGAILRGEPLVAVGTEGIHAVTLSNAMHLSSWTEGPVSLPFDEHRYYSELMKRVKTSRAKKNVVETVADTAGTY